MAKRLNLFFDADDTILDFDAAETAAVTRIFEEYGLINNKGIVEVYKEKNGDCWREFEQGKLERSQIGYQRFKRTFDTFNIQTDLDIDALNKKYWGYLGDQYQVIDGSKDDENVLGFLNYDKIKEGNMCRHIVMVLPFRASCDAMEQLLIKNKSKFKNLNEYHILNISS